MIKTEISARFCQATTSQEPDMDDVMTIVRATIPRVSDKPETYRYNQLHQRVSEVYIKEQLRMAAQTIPDLVEMIKIPDGTETENYRFGTLFGNTVVYDKRTTNIVTDIDGLIAIADPPAKGRRIRRWHPFIVEIKMSNYGFCNSEEEEKYSTSLTQIVHKPYSLKGIAPVLEYFAQLHQRGEIDRKPWDIGLILAMPPDQITPVLAGRQRVFVQGGGHILQFHKTLAQYSQSIYGIADRLNIHVA